MTKIRTQITSKLDAIFIKLDWLPDWMKDENGEQGCSSPGGGSLKDALEQLREFWPDMRPPL